MPSAKWDSSTKRIAAVLLIILLIYVVYLSRPVIPFLVIAALMAFLLVPIVRFFNTKLRIPKAIAVILAYLVMLIFVLLFPLILTPALLDAFGDINIDVFALTNSFLLWSVDTLEHYRTIAIYNIDYDLSAVVDPALDTLRNISPTTFIPSLDTIIATIPSTIEVTWGIASNVVGRIAASALAVILTLLYSIYLTVDGGKMIRSFIDMVPASHRAEFSELHARIRIIWASYFRGQFLLMVLIGVLTWLVGLVIGLPGALALGVIAGVLEILPNLGPILAAIPALLVALVQGSNTLDVSNFYFMLIVLAAYVLIQQIENNLIVPKILGNAMELHPLVVMVGVVVGATVAGLLGALIAAPTIATGRELISYTYAKILDKNPFPPEVEPTARGPSLTERGASLWQQLMERLNQPEDKSPSD